MRKKAKKKKAKHKPSSNGGNTGRDNNGRFGKGNTLGRGNKGNTNEKAKALKAVLLETITEKDIRDIAKKLAKKAKAGDTTAAKEIFDRLWGRAKQELDIEHSGSISFTEALSKATRKNDSD